LPSLRDGGFPITNTGVRGRAVVGAMSENNL
jgi:hypothetical protein